MKGQQPPQLGDRLAGLPLLGLRGAPVLVHLHHAQAAWRVVGSIIMSSAHFVECANGEQARIDAVNKTAARSSASSRRPIVPPVVMLAVGAGLLLLGGVCIP